MVAHLLSYPLGIANSTVSCLPRDVAISGEHNSTSLIISRPGQYDIRYFWSLGPDPTTNWSTQLLVRIDPTITVVTTVNCFDNLPLRP